MPADQPKPNRRRPRWWLHLAIVVGVLAALGPAAPEGPAGSSGWSPFSSFFDSALFSTLEQIGVGLALIVSIFALVNAWRIAKQVLAAPQGTAGMKEIAQAVRDGSDAYLKRQFTTVGVLLVFLSALIVLTKWPWDEASNTAGNLQAIAVSRGVAFMLGAIFSAAVGFFGMRLATTGNLRVAAAARTNFSLAMRLGYQT